MSWTGGRPPWALADRLHAPADVHRPHNLDNARVLAMLAGGCFPAYDSLHMVKSVLRLPSLLHLPELGAMLLQQLSALA